MPQGQTRTQYWGWYTISVSTLRSTTGSHKCSDVLSVGWHHKFSNSGLLFTSAELRDPDLYLRKAGVRFFISDASCQEDQSIRAELFQVSGDDSLVCKHFFTHCSSCGMLAPRKTWTTVNTMKSYMNMSMKSCIDRSETFLSFDRRSMDGYEKIWCCIFKCLLQASTNDYNEAG